MIEIQEQENGLTLNIKVKPKAKQNAILGIRADALLIAVTSPPDKGKANRAVIELIASELNIPRSAVEIISGKTNPQKVLRISGLTLSELRKKLKVP